MKENKYTIVKRRRLKKGTMIEEVNIEVFDVREGDDEIDLDVAAAIRKEGEGEF